MSIKKKWIGSNQIDGSKIKLLNNEALKAASDVGADLDILKVDANNKLQLLITPEVSSDPVSDEQLARKGYVDQAITTAVEGATISIAASKYVTAEGNDLTGDGSLAKPFATISAALASITDASPSKRYAIHVAPGAYNEASGVALKANVFIIGVEARLVRITGAVSLDSSFSGSGDHRSGIANVTLISAANFNWTTVTSAAGKLFFRAVLFNSTVDLYGYNNAIAQAQFDSCIIFGTFTVSGINCGVHTNNIHYGAINLNQHPNGGMATILVATGGSCQNAVTLTTTVTDYNRRCALFARNFWIGTLNINGASSYADVTDSSLPVAGANVTNGGNLVKINPQESANKTLSNLSFPTAVNQPLIPAATSSTNLGDWGKQWMWNFAYIHASSGTDAYFGSYPAAFGAETVGKSVNIQSDLAGLAANANGGDVNISTSEASGTGIRGKVKVNARLLDMSSAKITNLADGTAAQDAVTKAQLDTMIPASQKGAANGVAELDAAGKIPTAQLPALAITETFVVADQAAMLALSAQSGDVAVRTDESKSYILVSSPASTLANWQELLTPEDTVLSVNGQTGAVSLSTDDVAEGPSNLYYTDERAKAAAANQQRHNRIVLSATDITNGYVDVDHDIIGVPLVINGPSRIPLLPTDDFTVSGARITWNIATVGPGGEEALVEGEIIHVFYMG